MKTILSIIVGLILIAPTFISLFIYKRKGRIAWVYGGAGMTFFATVLYSCLLMEIRFPGNDFSEADFRKTYKMIFNVALPKNIDIVESKYERGSGLFGNETWRARISFNEADYLKLLDYVKTENELLLKNHVNNPLNDCQTGQKIIYTIQTNYMNPWNYNIEFFQDKKTVRLVLTIYGE